MPEMISSTGNPLVKKIRALRQRKGRTESGLFLVEGIHHVGEAVEAGWILETLVYAPDLLTSDFAKQLVEDRKKFGLPCVPFASDLFADIAEKDNPQGILALVRQKSLTLGDISIESCRFAAALVAPQDPGNVGTILRTLDAVGGKALFMLDGGVELYHPSAVRASMGTLFWIPVVQTSFDEFSGWARQSDYRLVGSSAHATTDYRNLNHDERRSILLLGSEQKGLGPEQLAACDMVVSMPMKGRTSSLNLAVAAGILLYAMKG
jgi:RNA methyltransferase, TrmH family